MTDKETTIKDGGPVRDESLVEDTTSPDDNRSGDFNSGLAASSTDTPASLGDDDRGSLGRVVVERGAAASPPDPFVGTPNEGNPNVKLKGQEDTPAEAAAAPAEEEDLDVSSNAFPPGGIQFGGDSADSPEEEEAEAREEAEEAAKASEEADKLREESDI